MLSEMDCQEDLFALGGVTHVSLLVEGLTPGTTYYTLPDGSVVSAAGDYPVTLNTVDGCDSVIITHLFTLPVYDITIDTAVCEGASFTLPDGTITTDAGVYNFDYISSLGCDSMVTVNLTLLPLPSVSIAADEGLCADAPPLALTLAPAGGVITGTGVAGTTFDPALAGVGGPYAITYIYTDGNGCVDSATTSIEVYALPDISFYLPDYACVEGDPIDMLPEPTGGIFSGEGLSGNMFIPSIAGTGGPYNITYAYTDAQGCSNVITAEVSVKENVVYAGEDTSLFIGESIQLFVFSDDLLSWSPEEGLSCTDCPDPWASPEQTTTYWVSETDVWGCIASDAITVNVLLEPNTYIFTFNAYTPNGDGANDYFFLYGPDMVRIINLMVYDRWGNMLYHGINIPANAETLGWDGYRAGLVAMEGVYAFVAEVELKGGKVVPVQGNITLIR
jgi:gliding motility-associated-like protein